MNLNEDLNAADLKFLKKFGLLGDQNAEEAEAPPLPEQPEAEREPDGDGEIPVPFEADVQPAEAAPAPEAEEFSMEDAEKEIERMQAERESTDEGFEERIQDAEAAEQEPTDFDDEAEEAAESGEQAEGPQGQGEESDGPQEAQDEAESTPDAEEGEGEDQEADAEEGGEPDQDEMPEDSPGEEEAEQEMPEQQAEAPEATPGNPEPIALDVEGNPIFVGSKIVSRGDGTYDDAEAEPYVADVMGRWIGDPEGKFPNNDPARMILIVERYDDEDDSDSGMETEDGRAGWAVASNLCAVVVEENPAEEPESEQDDEEGPEPEQDEPEAEPEPTPEPEQKKEAYFLDAEAKPLHDGDQVIVREQPNWCEWPIEAIAEVVMANRNGAHNPALLPMNFEDKSLGPWKSYDDRPAFAVAWGNQLTGIYKLQRNDERPERPRPQAAPPQPQPQQPDDSDDEPEIPGEDDRKAMTKAQRARFENIASRIFRKAEETFGKTKQSVDTGALLPGGIFDGEEVGQTLEVVSNGVTYRISVSAERVE